MAPWRTLLEAIIEAHDLALCADPPDPLAFEVKGWLEQFRDSVIAKAA